MSRVLFGLALTLVGPAEALACGGFFCSSLPIDQSKERIVFAVDEPAGEVEVHVQIFYTGASSEFAWVVPVPAVPEVGLSTDELFTQLSWRTQPQFWLDERAIGDCDYSDFTDDLAMEDGDAGGGAGGGGGGGGGGVVVVEQAQVGPYDQVTLQADTSEALLTWLIDNGYVIPPTVGTALAPYVADGASFVALKLQKDRDAGDIAPIKMRYAADAAMIPLVLTSIAAVPDMRLEPYVLSAEGRAVPDNYLHVRINEAAIDWLSFGSNYDDVITRAANEAGGQAFATDYAGPSSVMASALYWEGRFDVARLRVNDDPAAFVRDLLTQGFPRTSVVQNLLRAYIPMPAEVVADGVSERDFYDCLECYRDALEGQPFDPAGFADALDELVVTPMREAQELFTALPRLTRLTSSMSPAEMTVDPRFVLNRDMGDVELVHRAELVVDCTVEADFGLAPRKLVLSDGTEIVVPPLLEYWDNGASWMGDLDVPAALAIEDTSAQGQPTLVSDGRGASAEGVSTHNRYWDETWGWTDDGDGTLSPASACGGCAGAGGAGGWALLAGVGALRRRRR